MHKALKLQEKGNNKVLMGGIKGRKHQMVVDTQGNLHQVVVHRANIHDSKGGAVLADIVLKQQKKIKKILANLGYRGFFDDIVTQFHGR